MKRFMFYGIPCIFFIFSHGNLNAMKRKSMVKPLLFLAIEQGNIELVKKIVAQDPPTLYSFYNTQTPLQYALGYKCEKIFTHLLENNGFTHVSGNTNLLTLTACKGNLLFLKILLSSGKLCQWYKNEECDPSKEAFEKISIESINHYTQDHFLQAVRLLTYASADKQSLKEKFCDTSKYSDPNPELISWIMEDFPASPESKKFGPIAFLCPALHDTFETMIKKNIISLANIAKLKPEDFEFALILRNTKTLTTVLKLIRDHHNYNTAVFVVTLLHTALQKHEELCTSYVDEIKHLILDQYKNMLYSKNFTDCTFTFT